MVAYETLKKKSPDEVLSLRMSLLSRDRYIETLKRKIEDLENEINFNETLDHERDYVDTYENVIYNYKIANKFWLNSYQGIYEELKRSEKEIQRLKKVTKYWRKKALKNAYLKSVLKKALK